MSWGTPVPTYWVGTKPREAHRLSSSVTEVAHILLAFAVLTLDLVLLQTGSGLGILAAPTGPIAWGTYFAIAAAAALTGFLAHELAHKIVAQRRGLWAEFRASPMGLLFSFITASIGFLFAAPGATVVDGFGDLRDWGLISLAGPIVNLVEGGVFFGLFWAAAATPGHAGLAVTFGFLAYINGWFATFNLIPFGPLDGRKVWRWSPPAWAVAIAVSGALAATAFYYLYSGLVP
ncbi:MAG TPA: metalloprotease [Thermoplasmata archaeon]|nr:metalloprotease [Thermoplasmata archaeon]